LSEETEIRYYIQEDTRDRLGRERSLGAEVPGPKEDSMRVSLVLAIGVLVLVGSACQSISDSVTSPSRWVAQSSEASADSSGASADSSNAASRSSSGSSSPEDEPAETSYQDDVRVASRTYAATGGDSQAFVRQLGEIAERHGITDWEADRATWLGLGEGFQQAGLSQDQVDGLLLELGHLQSPERGYVHEGYQAAL
jgi:hypothetical protein